MASIQIKGSTIHNEGLEKSACGQIQKALAGRGTWNPNAISHLTLPRGKGHISTCFQDTILGNY
ncbi:hypothetical protein ACRRTK_005571 [Alexandromys fortis]